VVFAPGQAIESSLKQLAERRTDIFGVGKGKFKGTLTPEKGIMINAIGGCSRAKTNDRHFLLKYSSCPIKSIDSAKAN
jgi:hypothetical protein